MRCSSLFYRPLAHSTALFTLVHYLVLVPLTSRSAVDDVLGQPLFLIAVNIIAQYSQNLKRLWD